MIQHADERALQRFLDGEAAAPEYASLQRHLAVCAECRRRLDELRTMIAGLGAMPVELEPPGDLWPGIAARIGSPSPSKVRGLETRRRKPRGPLVFAGVLGMAAALILGIGLGRMLPRPDQPVAVVPAADPPGAAMLASYGPPGYDQAVADLEAVLDALRDRLQPETIEAVETNLAIIDRAIADARAALARDPANEHLHRHLAATLQLKIGLLRQVTGALSAHT